MLVIDDVLIKGNKIIIPENMRHKILERLCVGYLGIENNKVISYAECSILAKNEHRNCRGRALFISHRSLLVFAQKLFQSHQHWLATL